MRTMEEKQGEQMYVDILSNGGFKAFFGDEDNKVAVMGLLNTLLPEHRQIKEIFYSPTEHQGPVIGHSKEFRYDFMCCDASGAKFIVENILLTYDLGHDTLVTMTTGHLVTQPTMNTQGIP